MTWNCLLSEENWFEKLTRLRCQENKYKDFFGARQSLRTITSNHKVSVFIYDAWLQDKVFIYPSIGCLLILTFEMSIDIAVQNIEQYCAWERSHTQEETLEFKFKKLGKRESSTLTYNPKSSCNYKEGFLILSYGFVLFWFNFTWNSFKHIFRIFIYLH